MRRLNNPGENSPADERTSGSKTKDEKTTRAYLTDFWEEGGSALFFGLKMTWSMGYGGCFHSW